MREVGRARRPICPVDERWRTWGKRELFSKLHALVLVARYMPSCVCSYVLGRRGPGAGSIPLPHEHAYDHDVYSLLMSKHTDYCESVPIHSVSSGNMGLDMQVHSLALRLSTITRGHMCKVHRSSPPSAYDAKHIGI